jgi:glucose/arabinose dehydrogenase
LALALAGYLVAPDSRPTLQPVASIRIPKVTLGQTLATKLDVPWGMAFLANGSALVGQRPSGTIVRIGPKGKRTKVGTVPGVSDDGEGGLLGLALKPGAQPTKTHPVMLYAYLTTGKDNRVVRMRYNGTTLGKPKAILTGIPKADHHNGGALVYGPDGRLFIGTGDAGNTGNAQDKGSLGGKILRVTPSGAIPKDNPVKGSPLYSYGHRNVQGLAFDAKGRLWATEFGQDTWDEFNRILPGRDYGWPVVEGKQAHAGFVAPKLQWPTDQASPSGLAIAGTVAYLGALRGERLWAVPLKGKGVGTPKGLLRGRFGRLRNVVATPDGKHLWVTTSNTDGRGDPSAKDDRVLRLDLG